MTTLVDERHALVVRCDECRRLWPVTRERLEAVWEHDDVRDLHRCPVCVHRQLDEPVPPVRCRSAHTRPVREPGYEPSTSTGASSVGKEHDLSDAP